MCGTLSRTLKGKTQFSTQIKLYKEMAVPVLMYGSENWSLNRSDKRKGRLFPSFSLPDVLSDPTDLIRRKGTPFEAKTGHTAFIDGFLAEVFLSCKANARRSVHSPQDHSIMILIISDQHD